MEPDRRPSLSEMSDDERQRAASGLNEMLRKMGREGGAITEWWNLVPLPELGGRTAMRAWADGDHDAVRDEVERLFAASEQAASRRSKDRGFRSLVLQRFSGA